MTTEFYVYFSNLKKQYIFIIKKWDIAENIKKKFIYNPTVR